MAGEQVAKPAEPRAALRRDDQRARAFAQDIGVKRLRKLLGKAQTDLNERLKAATGLGGAGAESFTAMHLQLTLKQVRDVLRTLKKDMAGLVVGSAKAGAAQHSKQLVNFVEKMEKKFSGIARPLAINSARVFEKVVSGTETSALRRLMSDKDHPARPGILDRYGANVVGKFEEELQVSMLARRSWAETREAIVKQSPFLQQAPAHWAERILRTETMYAHNRSGWETMRAMDEELGDMVKILAATFDGRTSADSYAYHGQIRRVSESFDTWLGPMMHPPGRPNDREVVVPHRVSWPIPAELAPKSDGEVQERWIYEGRKGSPPPRPKLTTVPLEQFGAVQPPPVELAPEMPEELPPELPPEGPPLPIGEATAQVEELGPVAAVDPVYADAQATLDGWAPYMAQGKAIPGLATLPDDFPNVASLVSPEAGAQIENEEGVGVGDFFIAASKAEEKKMPDEFAKYLGSVKYDDDLVVFGNIVDKGKVLELVKADHPEIEQMPIVVKMGGKNYLAKGTEAAIAKKFKGGDSLTALVLDHDAALKSQAEEKKIAAAEAMKKAVEAAPVPKLGANAILAKKVGEAAGSNKGGFYEGTDGVKRYVKFYDDPAQAVCENLANSIYRDLGIGAPRSQVFEHEGKLAYASEVLEGETLAKKGITKATAQSFMKGFAADVVTGNWDAVGLSHDNAFVLPDGRTIRIDSGGTFLFRAKAGRKPADVLDQITEVQKFFDLGVNNAYAQVAQKAGYASAKKMGDELTHQLARIEKLQDDSGGWRRYVEDRVDPKVAKADVDKIVDMLEKRTKLLGDFVEKMGRQDKTPATPEPDRPAVRGVNYDDHPTANGLQKLVQQSADDVNFAKYEISKKAGVQMKQFDAVKSLVASWTGGYKESSTQHEVYKAVEKSMNGEEPTSATDKVVFEAIKTREKRWRIAAEMANELGEELAAEKPDAPKFFDLRRGMQGDEFVVAVARAWADEKEPHVTVPTYPVASWTLSEKVGNRYAGRSGVMFRWRHCPMENTFFDQVVDDGTFATTYGPKGSEEAEVIAGPGHSRGLKLPKHDQVVKYQGRSFTYEDRDELIEMLREAGRL